MNKVSATGGEADGYSNVSLEEFQRNLINLGLRADLWA